MIRIGINGLGRVGRTLLRQAVVSDDLQVVGESTRVRLEDPFPSQSPWFDGTQVTLIAARGERLGIQVLHRAAKVELAISGARVRGFDVEAVGVAELLALDLLGLGDAASAGSHRHV